LTFAVTYHCNYRCRTCYIWQKKPVNELSLSEIEEFFRKSNDFSWIDLTGGEPFLRKDFVNICEIIIHYCKNIYHLHFPTNGFLTSKIVEDIKKIRKFSSCKIVVTVSLDGDERLNDEIRGIKGGWRRQIETFKEIYKIKGVEVVLGMTLSGLNFKEFENTYNAVKNVLSWVKHKDFHISIMNYSEHFYENEEQREGIESLINKKGEELERIIETIKKYLQSVGLPTNPRLFLERAFLGKVEEYLRSGRTPIPCHSLRSSCFIDPTGEVYPCITYNKPLGNLRNYNFNLKEIWDLDKTKNLQKEIWNYDCPQCWTGCDGYQSLLGDVYWAVLNILKLSK
jgi:radical SAM protein with 4Fe4S-binding SPASM domain